MISRSIRLVRTANRSLLPIVAKAATPALSHGFSRSAFVAKESDDKRYTKPEYKANKPVEYAEIKSITDAPDDVSRSPVRSVLTEIDQL